MRTITARHTVMLILLCINVAAVSYIAYVSALQSQSLVNLKEGINALNEQRSHVESVLSNLETQVEDLMHRSILSSDTEEVIPTQLTKNATTWKTYTSKDFQFSLSYPEGDVVTDLLKKAVERGYPLPPGRALFQIIHSPTLQIELGPTPTLKAEEHMLEIIVKEPPAHLPSTSFCSFSRFGTHTEILIDNVKGEKRSNGSSCFFLEEKNMLVEVKVYLAPNSDNIIANTILDSIRFISS